MHFVLSALRTSLTFVRQSCRVLKNIVGFVQLGTQNQKCNTVLCLSCTDGRDSFVMMT